MTRKEKILRMIQKLPDDVTYDRVIDRLDLMRDIEIGLEQIERGEVISHEELEQELRDEGWLDEPKSPGRKKQSAGSRNSSNTSARGTPRKPRGRSHAGSTPK